MTFRSILIQWWRFKVKQLSIAASLRMRCRKIYQRWLDCYIVHVFTFFFGSYWGWLWPQKIVSIIQISLAYIYIHICRHKCGITITVITIVRTGAPSFAYHPNRTWSCFLRSWWCKALKLYPWLVAKPPGKYSMGWHSQCWENFNFSLPVYLWNGPCPPWIIWKVCVCVCLEDEFILYNGMSFHWTMSPHYRILVVWSYISTVKNAVWSILRQ